jgi:hypothetical protein
MTACLRNRRASLFAISSLLAAAASFAVACGSASAPTQLAPSGDDSGNPFPVDGNNGSVDATHDGGLDAPVDSPIDAPDDSPADTGNDAHVDSGYDAGPPVCKPGMSVGGPAGGTLVLSTPDPDLMGGVSDDGLVIAWTSLPSDDAGVHPVVYWAERATVNDAFGTPQALGVQFGVAAPDHPSLRGDGLRLVFVGSSRAYVYEVGRTQRGADFTIDDTNENFRGVNASAEGSATSPGLGPFESPALASTFKSEWAFIHGASGFGVSYNVLGVWSFPQYPTSLTPPASDAFKLTPTGWAQDGRTLFYWDSAQSVERAGWRDPVTNQFVSSVDLGTIEQFATPSGDCTQLYFSAPGAGGDLDIFVAPLQ